MTSCQLHDKGHRQQLAVTPCAIKFVGNTSISKGPQKALSVEDCTARS